MPLRQFKKETFIAAPAEAVFAWHEQPDAFAKLTPPWEDVRLLSQSGPISQPGSQVVLSIPLIPGLPWPRLRWVSEHRNYIAGEQFQDVQIQGPFAEWCHTHRVLPQANGCLLQDHIEYALPLGWLGELGGCWFIRWKLKRLFNYRHMQMQAIFGK